MKVTRNCLILVLLLSISGITTAENRYFRSIPDSVYTYSYNRDNSEYELASITYNYYQNGILDSTVTTSTERIPVSKTVNIYNEGLPSSVWTYKAEGQNWLATQKQEMFYDNYRRLASRVVTVWRTDHWENLNTFTYFYDHHSNLKVYHRDYWQNNTWTDFSTDSLFYDHRSFLTERTAWLTSTNQYYTRMLYENTATGLKLSQTRQDYLDTDWVNKAKTRYIYNGCGTLTNTYGEIWLNGNWEPDSRTDIYYHHELLPGRRRVPVCHNGHTLYIHVSQLANHLAHGDCPGECYDPDDDTEAPPHPSDRGRRIPFTVFPNPATDYITIRMEDQECPVSGIELMDYYGRPVRKIATDGEEVITIDLGSLRSGSYILRIISDTVYSTIISRK
ncbi:MAG: T9SS type A sorting domain-containing protein [Bacteroidales bacterium]|nr:T9SS type A sorting domain-containing protein [Bacteroidales bacterium]